LSVELDATRKALTAARAQLEQRDHRLEDLSVELDATRRQLTVSPVKVGIIHRVVDASSRVARVAYGRVPHRLRERIDRLRAVNVIRKSRLFDAGYYGKRNPEIAKAGVDPLQHYLRNSARQELDPNSLFVLVQPK